MLWPVRPATYRSLPFESPALGARRTVVRLPRRSPGRAATPLTILPPDNAWFGAMGASRPTLHLSSRAGTVDSHGGTELTEMNETPDHRDSRKTDEGRMDGQGTERARQFILSPQSSLPCLVYRVRRASVRATFTRILAALPKFVDGVGRAVGRSGRVAWNLAAREPACTDPNIS